MINLKHENIDYNILSDNMFIFVNTILSQHNVKIRYQRWPSLFVDRKNRLEEKRLNNKGT